MAAGADNIGGGSKLDVRAGGGYSVEEASNCRERIEKGVDGGNERSEGKRRWQSRDLRSKREMWHTRRVSEVWRLID